MHKMLIVALLNIRHTLNIYLFRTDEINYRILSDTNKNKGGSIQTDFQNIV